MPRKGISLHLGLNRVDPAHYGGWDGQLTACEADAEDMKAIALAQGFTPQMLLRRQATSTAVIAALQRAAAALKSGDLFFLSYSGHGGQVPDTNHDEADRQDETWVLYDRELVDDELYAVWGKFAGGYKLFRDRIAAQMPASQTPNYYVVGAANAAFERQKPFTI